MTNADSQAIITRIQNRDWTVLGKAISIIENNREGKAEIIDHAYRNASEDCFIIGLTGAGGSGKSTLTDKLIKGYRSRGRTVGVLAVDPSSPYTGGAVLGDRLRMSIHSLDDKVFIRSFANRGSTGGISRASKEALYLYKAFGFDIIIVESLGVGQEETDITNYVDVTAVVLAPGNGDTIQMCKAGTQEIADVFIVNKADKPEAETLRMQLSSSLEAIMPDKRPEIVMTVASENRGIDGLMEALEQARIRLLSGRGTKKRARIENEIFSGCIATFEKELKNAISEITDKVLKGEMTPYKASLYMGSRVEIK